MRVLTDWGFGKVDELPANPEELITVELENVRWGPAIRFKRFQIFEFGQWAVARVVVITGIGAVSSLLMFMAEADALTFFGGPCCEDETRFLLDLKRKKFEVNRQLGLAVERFLWLQTWLGRWGPERSAIPQDEDPTVQEFDEWQQGTGGTAGGIYAPCFLDFETQTILRFCITALVPRGVIYDVWGDSQKPFPRGLIGSASSE